MFIKLYAAAPQGIDAVPVTIEVHAAPGYDFTLVGLPDGAVKEAHERIVAAITVNGYENTKRLLTINMAPADIKKEGASYDLPLAIAILTAGEQIPTKNGKLERYMMMGELALDGTLRPIHGVLPIALCARQMGLKGIILPRENAAEAAVVKDLEVYGMHHMTEVIDFLRATPQELQERAAIDIDFQPYSVDLDALFGQYSEVAAGLDFADVHGQHSVRRAIEVAAAGGHNLLMVGPPGAGKSMMAKRLPTILPPLTMEEALETTKVHSVAGLTKQRKDGKSLPLIVQRPFRAPHHTITDVALVGGGNNPHPGEISLAHNGVLFLDELPEYKRSALEVLRQPLEDRQISVVRNKLSVTYPASFTLIAAMNPCPCGHYGENNPAHPCLCTPGQVHRYMSRISGPLLDRIDIQCEIRAVSFEELNDPTPGESSAVMRERVIRARRVQSERFRELAYRGIHCNAQMTPKMVREYCHLDETSEKTLAFSMEKLGLSARAYDRILKVARTIADLDSSAEIQQKHILEALNYRKLDREFI